MCGASWPVSFCGLSLKGKALPGRLGTRLLFKKKYMSTEEKIMEKISEALTAWGYREEGETSPVERNFYAVLWVCYDLLTRTELISSIQVPMPEEMHDEGDPDMVNTYGIAASPELDMLHTAITGDGKFPVDLRTILDNAMRRARITQTELAERIGVRQATISDFLNRKHGMSSETIEAALNELFKK